MLSSARFTLCNPLRVFTCITHCVFTYVSRLRFLNNTFIIYSSSLVYFRFATFSYVHDASTLTSPQTHSKLVCAQKRGIGSKGTTVPYRYLCTYGGSLPQKGMSATMPVNLSSGTCTWRNTSYNCDI